MLENLEYYCGDWATVITVDGRTLNKNDINDADVLLVRSVTKVDKNLLQHTNIKFVGTATIGIDHIDLSYLKENKIEFAYAPGCNANAVVDYVYSILFKHFDVETLKQKKIGILGYGNVGKRLTATLIHFGFTPLVFDPFEVVPKDIASDSFESVLRSDILSLHVPLTFKGEHATHHLFNEKNLPVLNDSCELLINTSRGSVIDNQALLNIMSSHMNLTTCKYALDVWENEPGINIKLLDLIEYASPHIAGYSYAGKQRGLIMVLNALKELVSRRDTFQVNQEHITSFDLIENLEDYRHHIKSLMNISELTYHFKRFMLEEKQDNRKDSIALLFDRFRKNYSLRKEIDYQTLLTGDNQSI